MSKNWPLFVHQEMHNNADLMRYFIRNISKLADKDTARATVADGFFKYSMMLYSYMNKLTAEECSQLAEEIRLYAMEF